MTEKELVEIFTEAALRAPHKGPEFLWQEETDFTAIGKAVVEKLKEMKKEWDREACCCPLCGTHKISYYSKW